MGDVDICQTGVCGNRRFLRGLDGWSGCCNSCAAASDDHELGLHQAVAPECPACA